MCLICMEKVSSSDVTTMDCGHHFCNTCLLASFVTWISQMPQFVLELEISKVIKKGAITILRLRMYTSLW
ncbi:hypothetical protein ACB092_02G105600 [Castanea dentata]